MEVSGLANLFGAVLILSVGACASNDAAIHQEHNPSAEHPAITYKNQSSDGAIKAPISEKLDAHPGDAWYPVRAGQLGITVDEARARDRAMHFAGPPDGFWDANLARETWSVWTMLCNECHGGTRRVNDVLGWSPPPSGFKDLRAKFFVDERYAGDVYDLIFHGARNTKGGEDMPAWGANNMLSREQIWGLVYFVRAETKKNSLH